MNNPVAFMDELWCFNLFCLFRMRLFSYGCLIYCDKSAQENILTCSVPVTVKHQGGGQQQLALPPWPAPVRAASPVGCRNKLGQHRRSVRFDQNRGQRTTPPVRPCLSITPLVGRPARRNRAARTSRVCTGAPAPVSVRESDRGHRHRSDDAESPNPAEKIRARLRTN
jgi:hypothetical protein